MNDNKLLVSLVTLGVSLLSLAGFAVFGEAEQTALVEHIVQAIAIGSGGYAAARANKLRKGGAGE